MSILKTSLVALGVAVPAILAQSATAMSWKSNTGETSEQIFASTSDQSAVSFICSGEKLSSAISVEDNNGANILDNLFGSRRVKTTKVTLFVNGEEANTSSWTYNIRGKVFAPKKSIVTAKLYNAAVRGDSVAIQRKGEDRVDLTLPAANDEFVNFGGACGVGSNKADRRVAKKEVESKPLRDKNREAPPPF